MGIGGLTAAATSSKRGQELLLKHQKVAGGLTQTFTRPGWTFARGVHYIGGVGPQPGPGGQFGCLLAWHSDGALAFADNSNPCDVVRLPGFGFGIEHSGTAYRQRLLARFPDLPPAIDDCFAEMQTARLHPCHSSGVVRKVRNAGGPDRGNSRSHPGRQQVGEPPAALGTVVAWNRPGIGASQPPRVDQTAAAIVSQFRALLAALRVPPQYALVGHSLGGLHGQYFASNHPDEVTAVVLLDATAPQDIAAMAASASRVQRGAQSVLDRL